MATTEEMPEGVVLQNAPEPEMPVLRGLPAGAGPDERQRGREEHHLPGLPLTEPEGPMPDGLRGAAERMRAAPPEAAERRKAAQAEAAEQLLHPDETQKDEPALPAREQITHAAEQHTEVPLHPAVHVLLHNPAQAVLPQSESRSRGALRKEGLPHPRQHVPVQEEQNRARQDLAADYRRSSI